jgi:hypothetical protein
MMNGPKSLGTVQPSPKWTEPGRSTALMALGVITVALFPLILPTSSASAALDVMAVPTLSTEASPGVVGGVVTGSQVTDTATLSGGSAPTGTVEFSLYGPGDPGCSGTPVFTSTTALSVGGTATSAPFTAAALGTYHWIASYSGDGSNVGVTGICGVPESESVTVVPAGPGAPTNVVATATSATSIMVSWTPPPNASGATVAGYTVTSGSAGIQEFAQVGFPATSVVLTGLQPGDTYAFNVTAYGLDGGTSISQLSNRVTLEIPAATALTTTTTPPSATSATLAFTGAPMLPTVGVGLALVASGLALLEIRRRRMGSRRHA